RHRSHRGDLERAARHARRRHRALPSAARISGAHRPRAGGHRPRLRPPRRPPAPAQAAPAVLKFLFSARSTRDCGRTKTALNQAHSEAMATYQLSHLRALEAEAIDILRELAAERE